jgi:hypothetical protein
MGLLGHLALLGRRADLSEEARLKAALIEEQARRMRDRIVELDEVRRLAGE